MFRPLCRYMVPNHLYWLDQLQPAQRSQVGDKAFDLAGLKQRHYLVPSGFVVTAATLQDFLASIDWQAEILADLPNSFFYVSPNNFQQLQTVSRQLQQGIQLTPLPKSLCSDLEAAIQSWQTETLIVRPSFTLEAGLDPTVSYRTRGLFNSHLCRANGDALGDSLKRVWCELFRARSLFYWQRLGIQLQQIQFAVLVQPIHSVMAAGELQINGNHLQIQAVWGLGHALAQGSHDDYRFEPSSGWQIIRSAQQIYSCQVSDGETTGLAAWITTSQDCPTSQDCLRLDLLTSVQQSQPVLTSTQLQQLAQLAQQLQTELGMPLRLEWMFDPVNLQTLPPSPSESSPRAFPFQITQITPQFGLLTAQRDAAIRSVAPLIGLAAAPGRAIAGAWLIRDTADLRAIPVGAIAVTSLVTPEQIMRLRQAAGVVTEQGGITSHAAILARELGIPAVVGVAEVTRLIRTGDRVAIDGDRGEVYYGDFSLESDWLQINPTAPLSVPLASSLPAPLSTRLFVTLSQLDHLAEIAALPVDGVGLLRSELMLLDRFQQDLPEVWLRHQIDAAAQIADRVEQFAAAFAPRSVFYRSFDLQLQEADPIPSRPHPMLGLRGAFSYQFNLDLLQVQLDALRLVQQRGYDNVSLLLPFVRTVEEFNFCRQQVEQVGLLQQQNFQLWIMAEVPSVLLLLPDYVAAGVQGIAIGTNDLTQLLLGADRNHPQMATAFDPAHPVVLRAIQQLIHTARQMGIPCSVCGQSVGRVDLLTQLLQWGVTSVSVDPSEVEPVYQTIQHYYQNQDLKEI